MKLNVNSCVSECPAGKYEKNIAFIAIFNKDKKCDPCHATCGTCKEGNDEDDCTSCSEGRFFYEDKCVT